jgi:hypothetical protein
MFLAADDTRRMTGLIWLDEAMSARPAAHVLIIGIGAYKSPKFKRTLTSTTISARAVADWFIDQGRAGFKNPSAPLGSVALLLSEPRTADGNDHAIYAGGTVLRATFSEAYTAVRDWVRRINTHKDNLAFLYVASHGESNLGRTAILLEDYGLDDLDATSGMSEVEQFVGALENALPINQLLLFDCCRTPTDIYLPWREQLGNKLISLTRRDDDHGQTRKQCVVLATAIDKAALGQAGNVTLFADALLQALDGVASDTTQPNWPVRAANLIDKINELLELYRLPGEAAQIAPGTTKGTFNVSVPGEQSQVPMYLSLQDPADWPDSVINVAASPGEKFTIKGVEGEPPFSKIIVHLMAEVTVEAARHGDEIGTATRKAYGPAVFLKISKDPTDAGTVVGTLDERRGVKPRAQIDIDLRSYVRVEAGAVAGIVRHDEPGNDPKLISVPLAGVVSQEVGPGAYGVTLWTPDGQVHKRDVVVEPDQILKLSFATPASPHEWLKTAATSGAIRGRKRVALVIGNSRYAGFQPHFRDSIVDADAMASLLRALGFEVTVGINLFSDKTADIIETFIDMIRDAEAALFFFSGFGVQVAGENYLMSIDGLARAEPHRGFVGSRELRDRMSDRADISILLLDYRRLELAIPRLRLTLPERLGQTEKRRGWVVASSSAIGFPAIGPHSPFVSALLRHLPTPGQPIDDIMRNVMDTMRETDLREARGILNQARSLEISLLKQFYFTPSAGSYASYPRVPEPYPVEMSETAGPMSIRLRIVGHADVDSAIHSPLASALPAPGIRLAESEDDGRFSRIDVNDASAVRFPGNLSKSYPSFVEITCGARRELAVIPSIGNRSKDIAGEWLTYLVVDRFSPIEFALTRVTVEDTRWLGLLGFLTSRSVDMAEKLLESGLKSDVIDAVMGTAIEAMLDKLANPLAAAAGALVAVAASREDPEAFWDPWLRNLTGWFPGIPDGPIILGRRLLMRARTAEQIAEARRLFFEGFDRGVPVYSLSAEWLARGLESLPGDDADLQQRRLSARRLANQVDPSQAFTVVRVVP